MADELSALHADDQAERERARERLLVDGEVRRAIYRAQTEALLALRDEGVVNDRIHQQLQLQLDRASLQVQTEAAEDSRLAG
jgi:hypothetical protein